MSKKKAVILLSGGLDSTTVLAIAVASGYEHAARDFLGMILQTPSLSV